MFNQNKSRAYAVYGDVIWHLTDRLNLTTGVRFTRDEREFSWYNPFRSADQLDATLAGLQAAGFFEIPGVPPIEALQAPLYQPGTNGNVEFNTLASTAAPLVVSNSWNDTSPRVVLDYKLTPDMDPHYSSGPPNLAFCLACKGVGGKSWEKVGQVWYRAMTGFGPSPKMTMKAFAKRTRELAGSMFDKKVAGAVDLAWKTVGL